MVEYVGVAVGIAWPCVSVQNYFHFRFPLPVSWPAFEVLMSDSVDNVRIAIGIAAPSLAVQK